MENERTLVDRLWATFAITLGAWEGVAVSTGWLPTFTSICHRAKQTRLGRITLVWFVGSLLHHLLKDKSDG